MTVIYQYRVANTSLGGFLNLLRIWKGSVYKLMYKELLIFISLYTIISLIYRLALTADQKVFFEGIVLELYYSHSAIPLSFVLGFYVTFIVQRWWQQFSNLPWPDRTLFILTAYLQGSDDKARIIRRTVARYMLTGLILICRAVSVSVMKRFPTLDHIVEAGFITKDERITFEATELRYQKFWVPLLWANNVLMTAKKEGRIQSEFGLRMIMECLADYRDKCSNCFVYDWVTVPLVYTQVVTFAVYSYFAVSLFGQQYLDDSKKYKGFELDLYFPGFTILQFLFYMGWLKVAEQMINPFGEDDDDFDVNWLIDRHTDVAFALVDHCHGSHPPLVRDMFWNDLAPDVPYTESSMRFMKPTFLGSTFNISPRGKGSMTESILSLGLLRPNRYHGDSITTLESNGSNHGRFLSIPNGKTHYRLLQGHDGEANRRSSIDLPVKDDEKEANKKDDEASQLRERANTDYEPREQADKERKLSQPYAVPLNKHTRKAETPPTASPKLTRFNVEPVDESLLPETEAVTTAKARRSGHTNMVFSAAGDKVSKVPELSAIEECNTITRVREFINHAGEMEDNPLFSTSV